MMKEKIVWLDGPYFTSSGLIQRNVSFALEERSFLGVNLLRREGKSQTGLTVQTLLSLSLLLIEASDIHGQLLAVSYFPLAVTLFLLSHILFFLMKKVRERKKGPPLRNDNILFQTTSHPHFPRLQDEMKENVGSC